MILEWVLEPTVSPYKYCTAENFSHYQAEQFFFPDSVKYDAYRTEHFPRNNEAWLRISLVCRAWATMAGPPPFLDTDAACHKYPLHNVRNMICHYRIQSDNSLEKMIQDHTSNRLTTLEIRQNIYGESFVGVKTLLDSYTAFPMLRSLCIAFESEYRVPGFWSRLEEGFPKLKALALTNCRCSRAMVTFANLEIFMYQSGRYIHDSPAPKLQLPRLRHCTIDQLVMNTPQFILDHGHQLESLCFFTPDLPSFPADLWELFPNLSTLEVGGSSVGAWEVLKATLPPLPFNHPLCRLILHLSSNYVDAESVGELLGKAPTIRHLSITQSYFGVAELSKTRRVVTRHGVIFDVHAVVDMFPLWRRIMNEHPWGPIAGLGTCVFVGLLYVVSGVICWCERVAEGYRGLYRKVAGVPAIII
jgi:hypothetical protein